MKISIAEKKTEAIKRMKLIRLLPSIIKDFEKDGVVHYSDIGGILYWISNNPEWEDFIKKFEAKYDVLVYHAEFSRLEFGDCLSLFYVSDHKDEWKLDIEDLKENIACCYVWNIDDPTCSEFGSIAFIPMTGGVKRTA